jgi:hypothetical protein
LQQQAQPALSAPQHVAENGVVDERKRRTEKADAHIGVERFVDARFGGKEPLANERKQWGKQRQQNSYACRHQAGAPEHRLFLRFVAPAEGLRYEPRRACANEIEGGEYDVEDQRARRQPSEKGCIAELSDDCGIDQAKQGRGQIGERNRDGDGKNRAVGDGERPHGRCRR